MPRAGDRLYCLTLPGASLYLLHVLEDFGEIVAHPDFTAHGEIARDYFNELEKAATKKRQTSKKQKPQVPETQAAHQFLKSQEQNAV